MRTESNRVKPALVALIGLLAVVLSGCGLKPASVTTFDENFKGERVITVTVPQTQVTKHTKGGVEAADAAITKHLPEGVTYSGASTSGENLVGTFTIAFDGLDDYKAKMTSLLAAGGKSEPTINIFNSEDGLVTGFSAFEDFNDADLLAWAQSALEAEGAVKQSAGNVFATPDKPVVKFGDKSYTSERTSMNIKDVIDNGVKNLAMVISLLPGEEFETALYLDNYEPMTAVQREKVTEYLNEHLPEGASISDEKPTDKVVSVKSPVTVKFTAESLEAALTKLQTVMEQTSTSVEFGEISAVPGSMVAKRSLHGKVDCGVLCSTSGSGPRLYFKVPSSWQLEEGKGLTVGWDEADSEYRYLYSTDPTFVGDLKITLPTEGVKTDLALGLNGGLTYTMDVVVNGTADPSLKESYDAVFTIDKAIGEVSSSDKDGNWIYTLTFEGKDARELSSKLSQFIPESEVVATDLGIELRKGTRYSILVPVANFFGHALTSPVEQTVSLPFMHSLVLPNRYLGVFEDVNSRTLKVKESSTAEALVFEESGPGLSTFIIFGVVLVLLLLAAIIAWLKRAKIKAWLAKQRQVRAQSQVQAQQVPSYPAASGSGQAPPPGYYPPAGLPPTYPNQAPSAGSAPGAMPPPPAAPPTVYPGAVPPADDFEIQ